MAKSLPHSISCLEISKDLLYKKKSINQLRSIMHPTKQSYDEFKIWCAKQKYPLARTALNIASNRDNTNRTGHIMRGFLAARQYLHEYPEIIAVVKSRKLSVKKPIDTSNEKFIKTWLDFMENHKTQHAILQHILPIGLGGNVDSGGGGRISIQSCTEISRRKYR